jgi:mannose-6-phosphate isomerase-like protein (cupin superfamily)
VLTRNLKECDEFVAGDNTRLRELLHPAKVDLALGYSLAHAALGPGEGSLPHKLKTSEVYFILEGEGEMHIDADAGRVGPGTVVYIPPNATQYIVNTGKGELAFLCIVDPAWRPEDEEIMPAAATRKQDPTPR